MNLLITGGAGFIGRFFCERLIRSGYRISILDLVSPPVWIPSGVHFVQGDVRDRDAVRAALCDCEAVLHLAAAHHDFGISPATYHSVNKGGAQILCAAMDEFGIQRLCFYSSVAVYGAAPEPHREESPCRPVSPYGESKLAGEEEFRRWVAQGGARSALIIRPTVVFGPRNFANMFALIRQIDRGRFLGVGKGRNVKSLCYVENIVDATMYVWERDGRPPFDVYNYVDKPDLTSREIANAVYRALGRAEPRVFIPLWLALLGGFPFDVLTALTGVDFGISSARVKKFASTQTQFAADKIAVAGHRPSVSLSDGITRMVEWYRAEGRTQTPVRHLPPADIVDGES